MRGARKGRWWRWLLLPGLGLLALLLVILAALPWWLPWGLKTLGGRFGFRFGQYERQGYDSFVLRDVRWEMPGLLLRAEELATRSPLFLLGGQNWLRLSGWDLVLGPSGRAPVPGAPDSTGELFDELVRHTAVVQHWLAQAQLRDGRVNVGGRTYQVPMIGWDNGILRARIAPVGLDQELAFIFDTARGDMRLAVEPLDLQVLAQLRQQADQWRLTGRLEWVGNTADWSLVFGRQQWLPTAGLLVADPVRVPADRLPWEGMGPLQGALWASWDGDSYTVQLAARSDQLQAELAGQGDLSRLQLERLVLKSPIGRAQLSRPLQVDLQPLRFSPAVLQLAADVPGSPLGPVTGALQVDERQARLQLSGTNGSLVARYDVSTQQHNGQVRIERWQLPPMRPVAVQARWDGQGLAPIQATLVATGGLSRLEISGTWRAGSLAIAELTLQRSGRPVYALAEPVHVSLQDQWVRVSPLRWLGPQGRIELAGAINWPVAGDWHMRWEAVRLAAFGDLLQLPIEEVRVAELSLSMQWDRGPADMDLALRGALEPTNSPPLHIRAQLRTESAGLRVGAELGVGPTAGVLQLQGSLPLALRPAQASGVLDWGLDQPLQLSVRVGGTEALWRRLARATGVMLRAPQLDLQISGTPTNPVGQLTLRVQAVDYLAPAPVAWPGVGPLAAELVIGQTGIGLESLRFEIEGQPVRFSAQLPMDPTAWAALLQRGQWPDWRQVRGRLQIENARLAPLARFWPTLLAPEGRLAVDLALRPGGALVGGLAMVGAATRPLPPIGPIDQIRARLNFHGRRAEIEEFSGRLGGQPVNLTGHIHVPNRAQARVDLRLRGRNVPIVREPGLLVRADADLRFEQGPDQPPLLRGQLQLRQSLFLRELELLAPGQLAQVQRRPPYFSVTAEPLADWRLDLQVQGQQFLQVRSPVFRGVASANFDLTGTLKDPLAVGTVKVESGTIKFPFTDFRIEQGTISLASEDPYHPRLSITAMARSFGYDLRLEVSGTADAPLLLFSATPPLSSEEILLMVTAGQLPQGEYEFTTSEKASRLALFLGRDLLRKFGAESGAAERLTIRSGEDITEQGGLTYSLEYQLSDRWSVYAEQDRFDQYNVGVRWRVFSR